MSVLDKLAGARSRVRTEELCLDGVLEDEYRALVAQVDKAINLDEKGAAGASLANPVPHTSALVDQMEAKREEIAQAMVTFAFRAIDWTERVELQAEHPPREGRLVDQVRGYNVDTFVPALVRACLASVTDSDGDTATADQITDDLWSNLTTTLNHRQWTRLFAAAYDTTDGETSVPPSARSLLESQDSGASLAQPDPGTSPRAASAGGSRRGSRKSAATTKAGSTSS